MEQTKNMRQLRIGNQIRIVKAVPASTFYINNRVRKHRPKSNEEFIGTVKSVAKRGRYSVIVDVETFKINGEIRHRWKRKDKLFGNSSKLTIFLVSDRSDYQEQLRKARKAFVGTSRLFQARRAAWQSPLVILGLEQGASTDDIKRAYRRLAMKYHPDKNPNDSTANDKFVQIAQAYHALNK